MCEKIRVLLLKPGEKGKDLWITPTHDVISDLVGGEFDLSNPMDEGTVIIFRQMAGADEKPVFVLRNSRGQIVTRYYGTIIVAGLFTKGAALDSLTDDEVRMATGRLEVFDGE